MGHKLEDRVALLHPTASQISHCLTIYESGICTDSLQAVYKKILDYTGEGSLIPVAFPFAAVLSMNVLLLPMGHMDDGVQYVGMFGNWVALPVLLTIWTTAHRIILIHTSHHLPFPAA